METLNIHPFDEVIDRNGTNAEKYTLRQKLFGTDEVLPMWVADMDIPTPQCVLDAVQQRLKHPVLGYEIMPDSAYMAQMEWFKTHHDVEMKREWLSYSPSVVASIGCAIRAFSEDGDEVIVMDPVYPPFHSMVHHNNRRLVVHPLLRDAAGIYRFDIDRLRSQITSKTRMLLLCSPHNPIGRVWSKRELTELATLCLEYGIVIVSDEIHCDLVYAPHRHVPIAALGDEVAHNSVTLMGPGKTFNMAGFAISTVSIPSEKLRAAYERERSRIHWGEGNVLSHVAFEAAYRGGAAWHQALMAHLDANRKRIEVWAAQREKIVYAPPEGTYLAWLDCRALGLDDRELQDFFVHRAGLGLSPGLGFGKEGSGFMRLNFAVASSVLERALHQLSEALSDSN